MTTEAQRRYEHHLSELAMPRPMSEAERSKVAGAAYEEARSERSAARIGLALSLVTVMAATFFVVPAEVGIAMRFGAVVVTPIVIFSVLTGFALVFGWFSPIDAAWRALYSETDLREEAKVKAFPPEVGAEELTEVAEMIERHPDLAPIVREWLDRGPITLAEVTALRYAAHAGDQAVAAHAAIQRLRGEAPHVPGAAQH